MTMIAESKNRRSPEQNKMLWALAGKLGLDSEALHEVVEDETGKEHISELTKQECARCIDRLEGRTSRPPGSCSHGQIEKILKLGYLNFSGDATPELKQESMRRLRGWIKHMTHDLVSDVEGLSRHQANVVIESLRGRAKRTGIALEETAHHEGTKNTKGKEEEISGVGTHRRRDFPGSASCPSCLRGENGDPQ